MNRTPLFLVALGLGLGSAGCPDDVRLTVPPNNPPMAVAAIYDPAGIDRDSAQFLDYVVEGRTATLDASLSRDGDAAGTIEARTWTLEAAPEGSALTSEDIAAREDDPATEDFDEANLADFVPDVLGTYRIGLVVTDDDEASSEMAFVSVQSIPPSGLEIRLDWSAEDADLDAHLTEPGGVYFDYSAGSTDCFSWNPNPDWGSAELAVDNPDLASDEDGAGAGPYRESIFLDTPQETGEAQYMIRVHYYSDHNVLLGGSPRPANPTLKVLVLGELIAELSPSQPLNEGDVWTVGTVSWPEMEFSQISTLTTHTALGGPDYNL